MIWTLNFFLAVVVVVVTVALPLQLLLVPWINSPPPNPFYRICEVPHLNSTCATVTSKSLSHFLNKKQKKQKIICISLPIFRRLSCFFVFVFALSLKPLCWYACLSFITPRVSCRRCQHRHRHRHRHRVDKIYAKITLSSAVVDVVLYNMMKSFVLTNWFWFFFFFGNFLYVDIFYGYQEDLVSKCKLK